MDIRQVSPMFIVLLLHLDSYQSTTVTRHYRVAFPDYRMSQWSMVYQDMPLVRCLALCSENVTCYYVSYDVMYGDCTLSQWSVPLSGKVVASNVTLYELEPPCPQLQDYKTVGNYSGVAVCSQSVTKTEADSACAYYGGGRLIEPRTVQMHLDMASYLTGLSHGSVWIGAEYDNDWKFPDGSLLPLTAGNSDDVDGTRRCMRMRSDAAYKYADQPCDELYGYMCERI